MAYKDEYGVAVYKEYEDVDPNSKFPFEIKTVKGTIIFEDIHIIRIKTDFGKIREINKNDLVRFKPKERKVMPND